MAIVPIANGIAIVATNQRHHRMPFTRRAVVATHMFGIAMAVGCALFVLLLWRSHAIASRSARWQTTACVPRRSRAGSQAAALFGVTSSAHASIAHAWLAFEV